MLNHKEWIRQGPLYKWRREQQLSQTEAAMDHRLMVSMTTWQLWERGNVFPGVTNLKILIEMTGIEDLEKQWQGWLDDWANQKPDDYPEGTNYG